MTTQTAHSAQSHDAMLEESDTILADWDERGYRSRRFSRHGAHVCCPRCEGYGEEPGAPEDEDGTCRCFLCHGQGRVPEIVAKAFVVEMEHG